MPAPPTPAAYLAGSANWVPTSASVSAWATQLQILIGGTDVTFFRGMPSVIESWQNQEPFGDSQAIVDFPQVTQFDTLGASVSSVPWAYTGASAQINVVYPDTSTKALFKGFVSAIGDRYAAQSGTGTETTQGSSSYLQMTLQGTLFQGAFGQVTPYFSLWTQDAALLIINALNQQVGARWGTAGPVTTVAAGSNGVNVNTFTGSGTLNVAGAATAGFPKSGYLTVNAISTSASVNPIISYTGISGTTFTGCQLLSGQAVLATGQEVTVASTFPIAANGSFTNVLEYVQDCLGQALKLDGSTQWTVQCDNSTDPPTPWVRQKNPNAFLAAGTDGVTNGTNTLTSASGLFTPDMVGQSIRIGSIASVGPNNLRTVASWSSSTSITFSGPTIASATSVGWQVGAGWTIDAGAPGVDLSGLDDDLSLNTNVLYGSGTTPAGVTTPFNLELFGIATGFDPGGQTFMNSQFPTFNFNPANPTTQPYPYPYSSAASVMTTGSTNSGTLSGHGVSLVQQQIGTTVNGTYGSSDATAVEAIQTAAGISVDGIVGPQTWMALFAPSFRSDNYGAAIVLPLYEWGTASVSVSGQTGYQSPVDPWIRNSQGYILASNAASAGGTYNPAIMRVEEYCGMGAGITLTQAKNRAQAQVNRDYTYGSWAGTIVLTSDPHEGSRFEMRAGDNLIVNYFHGASVVFHVNEVDVAWDQAPSIATGPAQPAPTLQVTLSVDTAARDSLTSKSAINHEPGTFGDPVRRPSTLKRNSRNTRDTVLQFDASAGTGIVQAHALYGGLWIVCQIPFGQNGTIRQTTYQTATDDAFTTAPPAGFYLAVFNQPITPATIISILGNSGDPSQTGIWQTQAVSLKQAGLLIEWGGNNGNGLLTCGYYNSNTNSNGGTLNGYFLDDLAWNYVSTEPPWLWVAEYSPSSCFIQGRFEQVPGATPS